MKHLPELSEFTKKFIYDPETGEFSLVSGGPATRYVQKNGYIALYFGGYWQAHRVAWLYMTGEDPYGFEIDHINGIADDNRWSNLRKLTLMQNAKNLRLMKSNTTGFKGVTFRKPKTPMQRPRWTAQINSDGRVHLLGNFDTAEEASKAYQDAAEKLHGDLRRMEA